VIQRIPLAFPPGYRLASVVFSHGWCSLEPFIIQIDPLYLFRDIALGRKRIVRLHIRNDNDGVPEISAESLSPLSPQAVETVRRVVESILRVDTDMTPFYAVAARSPRLRWAIEYGAGRMLRGETFFEDAVKTILTTNCSWSLTTSMNANLIRLLGEKNRKGWSSFPTPASIAAVTPEFLRRECKLGYRAEYIHELAASIESGSLDIEGFRTSKAGSVEMFDALCRIKGIGAYAAANLMRMLGRFDYLGLDSWCRSRIASIHGNGAPLDDSRIESMYARFGEWKGLAMWLEVTKDWYFNKFPID